MKSPAIQFPSLSGAFLHPTGGSVVLMGLVLNRVDLWRGTPWGRSGGNH